MDDKTLARPVKDTDLLLLGSAHPVPREDCFRRWQSMALSISNSLEQWAFEPHSLWSIPDMKAIVASLPHKAGKKHAGPGNIPWPAGQIMQGGNKKVRIN